MKLALALPFRNSRTTDTRRHGGMGEFLAGWGRAGAACALFSNSRTTDTLRHGGMGDLIGRSGRAVAACTLCFNSRTTDTRRHGGMGELLARSSRAVAACALCFNSRTTESLRHGGMGELLGRLSRAFAACTDTLRHGGMGDLIGRSGRAFAACTLCFNSRTTESLRHGGMGEFLARSSRAEAACALQRDSRTTDSLRHGGMGELLGRLSRAFAACTDTLRHGGMGEFLVRWGRAGAACALFAAAAYAQAPIRGFSEAGLAKQRALEAHLLALPDPARIEGHMKAMASEPHHAGSPASRKVAEYALKEFRAAGLEAKIETFEALLPYPKERALSLGKFKARLSEPNFAEDPDSTDKNQLPTYNAYSADGDITAPLVYVNYGVPEDYEYLKKQGVDVRGKIVIARYGQSWRGVKPKVAAENGAVACLIYSDPKEDGYFRGDVYPAGAYRCEYGVQRGSVMDMSLYVGDPLSPGFASEPGGQKRLSLKAAKTLMTIPVMPISYGDAKPLLESLGGPIAPEGWRGALPITYKLGPGSASAHLKLTHDWGTRPVHNVIATIRGSVYPDQWVLYGNHHDAWVNGANDPISGASAVLETARAFGEMYKKGWRPQRTIVFALWDAEEFGLVGSTEWVEKHLPELKEKAVAYFNSDSNGKGVLGLGATPALNLFLEQVARDVKDPVTNESVLSLMLKIQKPFQPGPLGSGSDYVGFVHHGGIAGVNFGFSSAASGGGGVYHSIFDSFAWYKRFSDGEFVYGKALAQVAALSVVRMSEAPIVPFEFTRAAATITQYWTEVEKLAADRKVVLPDLRPSLARLDAAAKQFEADYAGAKGGAREVYLTERALLLPEGLPGRPWYKGAVSAPGQYTGYGAKTIAGVRESLELNQTAQALDQAKVFAAVLDRYAAAIVTAGQRLPR